MLKCRNCNCIWSEKELYVNLEYNEPICKKCLYEALKLKFDKEVKDD